MAERNVELYMLAPENEVLMQSFVLKTGNGRLIVVDGGMARTNETQDRAYLPSALRAIADVGETG